MTVFMGLDPYLLGLLVLALFAVAATTVFWLVSRRRPVFRKQLPRMYELSDLIPTPAPPGAYFRNLDQSLADIPQKLKQYRDIERDLQGLDPAAWAFLKEELAPLLVAKDRKRGWQPLFDKLNQAKAFNYLKNAGYLNIRFVPPSGVKGQQTPDLQADGALCEVKTVNISEIEADRRASGGVGTSTNRLNEKFFGKLSSDLQTAKAQMVAFNTGSNTKYIAYVIVNFDDNLHEYADRYQVQIDQYIAGDPVAGLEVVVFDIKPPFYTATL